MSTAYIRSGSGIIARDKTPAVVSEPEPTIVSVEVSVQLDHLREALPKIVEEAVSQVFEETELPLPEQSPRRKRGRRSQPSAGELHD